MNRAALVLWSQLIDVRWLSKQKLSSYGSPEALEMGWCRPLPMGTEGGMVADQLRQISLRGFKLILVETVLNWYHVGEKKREESQR